MSVLALGNGNEPIEPAPPGLSSNFVDPATRKNSVFISAGICLPIILLFATIRLHIKLRVLRQKTWDDFTFSVALIGGIVYICIVVAETAGGPFGLHVWDTKLDDYTKRRLVLSLLVQTFYGPCIWFLKLSVLILYLNLFGLIRWLRYNAYIYTLVTGIFYCVTAILFVVFCGPEGGFSRVSYLKGATSPKCNDAHDLVYAQGIMNILSDLYLFILPLPAVWSLQMPSKRKLDVAAMFSTGLSACVASVLGLIYRILALQSTDSEWTTVPVQITAIVEITAGLSVCCMPMTKIALKRAGSQQSRLTPQDGEESEPGRRPFLNHFECQRKPSTSSTESIPMHQKLVTARDWAQTHFALRQGLPQTNSRTNMV